MRENRTCGSEGGEAQSLPYPYPAAPRAPCSLSTINSQPPTNNQQPPTNNYQLSTINYQLSTINYQLFIINCSLLIVLLGVAVGVGVAGDVLDSLEAAVVFVGVGGGGGVVFVVVVFFKRVGAEFEDVAA